MGVRLAVIPALLCAAQLAVAEPVRINLDDARVLAAQHLVTGRPDLAETLSRGLLLKNPDDVSALVMLSRALRLQGKTTEATRIGKTAWQAAQTDREKFFAAKTVAQALSAGGNRTRAQLWLRRAAEVAPDDTLKASAIRDFRHVKRRNPLTTRFSFGVTPTNNLNNSPDADRVAIKGTTLPLSGTQRALSGTVTHAGLDLSWRKAASANTLIRLGFQGNVSRIKLSSEARAQAPTLTNDDFASDQIALRLGLTHRQKSGPLAVDLSLGKRWQGGDPLARTDRLSLSKSFKTGPDGLLQFSGFAEDQTRLDNPLGSSNSRGVGALWATALDNGARLTLRANLTDVQSKTYQIDHHSRALGLYYRLGTPVLGAELTLSADIAQRDYQKLNPQFGLFRADTEIELGASMFFAQQEIYGFAPTVDVNARRNASNLGAFDARELSISFGLRSAF